MIRDTHVVNPAVNQAVKWAWPIIGFFFSILGIASYLLASRPPGISRVEGEEARQEAFESYVENPWRKVTGSVIHCVGGDGLGIITAMIFARIIGLGFWSEFWTEYVVGYLIGWFILQFKAMSMMADSTAEAL